MHARRILSNTAYQSVGKILVVALSFITVAVTTRYLGQEQYGALATATVFLSFFAIVTDLGLSTFAIRELAQSGADKQQIVASLFSLRIVMALVAIILAVIIIPLFHYPSYVVEGVAIMAPSLLFNGIGGSVSVYFQQNLQMRYFAVADVLAKFATTAGLIAVAKLNLGLNAVYLLNVAGSIVIAVLMLVFIRKHLRISFRFDSDRWGRALLLSLPLGLAAVLNTIYYKVDTILLSILDISRSVTAGVGNLAAVGFYNVPYRLIEIILMFPSLFVLSVFPIIASRDQPRELLAPRIQKAFDALSLVAAPMAAFVIVYASKIITVIAGPTFLPSTDLLKILIIGVSISFLNVLLGYALVAKGGEKDMLKISVISIVINIALNLVLIPRISYYGAALNTVLGELTALILVLYLLWRSINWLPNFASLAKASAIAGVLAFLFSLFPQTPTHGILITFLYLAIVGTAYLALYCGLVLALRVVSLSEVKTMLSRS